jgi:hypothetical protein
MKRHGEDIVDAAPQQTLGSISFWPMLLHIKQRISRRVRCPRGSKNKHQWLSTHCLCPPINSTPALMAEGYIHEQCGPKQLADSTSMHVCHGRVVIFQVLSGATFYIAVEEISSSDRPTP